VAAEVEKGSKEGITVSCLIHQGSRSRFEKKLSVRYVTKRGDVDIYMS
jgi:hypothetical protein